MPEGIEPASAQQPHTAVAQVRRCAGQTVKEALRAAGVWLERHAEAVNALNVFPVPDGDTGTNMVLTMNAALAEIDHSPRKSASEIITAFAHGALMGARGNSGVILSQLLRGLARSMDSKESFSASDLAQAMKAASETAYQGVIKPVEGTILTVAREAAQAALETAQHTDDTLILLRRVLRAAQIAVAHTPEQLAVLKEAGVVDAGGQGLVYILEGILRHLSGETVETDSHMESVVHLRSTMRSDEGSYGYDVQFIIKGDNLNVPYIRDTIDSMGDSALVVGDKTLVRVHVHVHDPGTPISFGISQGALSDVIVENMEEQFQEFVLNRGQAEAQRQLQTAQIATVCVVPGDGFIKIFESLGAGRIVRGGQTMNPSTQEILEAIEGVAGPSVLVLPNNSNVILAANQAKELSSKQVYVVPTRTVPQGISALLAFNYQADIEANYERMCQAAKEIQTIEVTRAIRTTTVNGLAVAEGDVLGLLNDNLLCAGQAYAEVVLDLLTRIDTEEYEIMTVYYGADAGLDDAHALASAISKIYPHLEVEVLSGGQAHYQYIISLE